MKRIITLVVLALILSACSQPATSTPTLPAPVTARAAHAQRAGCFCARLHGRFT